MTRLIPYGFSGAVLVAHDGKIVLKKGYGLANRAARQPICNRPSGIVRRVDQQGIRRRRHRQAGDAWQAEDNRSHQQLPAGSPADKAGITIHHLLTHTAGFAGDLGGGDEVPIERDALVAKVLAAPLVSKPGERLSIERGLLAGRRNRRTGLGQGYEAFVCEHLFLPAGMRDTGYQIPAWPLERLPRAMGKRGAEWGRVYKRGWLADGLGWYLRANGGIHASLDDLYRWHVAIESTKILSAEALASTRRDTFRRSEAANDTGMGGESRRLAVERLSSHTMEATDFSSPTSVATSMRRSSSSP